MNAADEQFLPGIRRARIWLALALGFAAFMPSNDSIWIDEAQTAIYARQPTLGAWTERLQNDIASEAQMPLGMAAAWLGGKIVGTREWQLRVINVIWTAATIWIVWLIGCRFRAPALALVAAAQPFLWFYANEARPYSLQIAGGACLLLAGIVFVERNGRGLSWVLLWAIAAIVLCASSMLGVIPVAIVSLWLAIALFRRGILPERRALLIAGGTVGLLALLGYYYLETLRRGAGGAMLWPVGLGNLAFSAYELLGFAGLGPARQILRDASSNGSFATTLEPFLALLGLFAATLLLMFTQSILWLRQYENRALRFLCLGVPIVTGCVLFAMAKPAHFPFWGRHLAPIAPFLTVGLGLPALHSKHRLAKGACCLWLALLFLSSLELRFASRHAKDDNRSAAALAQSLAPDESVWWALDQRAGEYYGIVFRDPSERRGVLLLPSMSPEKFQFLAPPDLIFTSKPETFDIGGRVGQYVATHKYIPKYHLQAITGWIKSPNE